MNEKRKLAILVRLGSVFVVIYPSFDALVR